MLIAGWDLNIYSSASNAPFTLRWTLSPLLLSLCVATSWKENESSDQVVFWNNNIACSTFNRCRFYSPVRMHTHTTPSKIHLQTFEIIHTHVQDTFTTRKCIFHFNSHLPSNSHTHTNIFTLMCGNREMNTKTMVHGAKRIPFIWSIEMAFNLLFLSPCHFGFYCKRWR